MKKRNQVLSALFLLSLVVLQQNCSDVTLVQSSELEVAYTRATVQLCLDQSLSDYTLEVTLASNLNLLYRSNGVVIDTDGDGLSDVDEMKYGFDPRNSRSDGKLLDKVCLELTGGSNCSAISSLCTPPVPNMLGLTDCDLRALGLDLFPHPDKGLDTDQDGIPDFLEIRLGTVVTQDDALEDPDHDLKTNLDEVTSGSNHKVYDQPQRKKYATYIRSSRVQSSSCAGELWQIDLDQLPWFKLPGVFDVMDTFSPPPNALSLSRINGTNTGLLYVKLKPRTGAPPNTNSKVLFSSFIISENMGLLSLDTTSFVDAGDVLP